MKIGRNDPCPCGSGKKYKKCCIWKDQNYLSPEQLDQLRQEAESFTGAEPNVRIIPSLVFKGYRWRTIWNTLHYRPLQETFHEFLIFVLTRTLGDDWLTSQQGLPIPHVVATWLTSWNQWRADNAKPENQEGAEWGATPSGNVMALMQLAYDLFCLQTVNKLPDFLVEKLKSNGDAFQGARYEIATAAIMARAGFDITFLDDMVSRQKHCEFIAKHVQTGQEIGVEAKSRRKPGVLHDEREPDPAKWQLTDVNNLVSDALKQKPDGLPYVIFVDLNMPPTDSKPFEALAKLLHNFNPKSSPELPDIYSAVAFTNFSHYYNGEAPVSKDHSCVCSVPLYSAQPLDELLVQAILASLNDYSKIPRQV